MWQRFRYSFEVTCYSQRLIAVFRVCMHLLQCGAFSMWLPWLQKPEWVLQKCTALRNMYAKTEVATRFCEVNFWQCNLTQISVTDSRLTGFVFWKVNFMISVLDCYLIKPKNPQFVFKCSIHKKININLKKSKGKKSAHSHQLSTTKNNNKCTIY